MTIYSIGHSNVDIGAFIELLKANLIEILVDVRSQPYSRYLPHFSQSALKRSIQDAGITYRYLGDKIGGRPEDKTLYYDSGKVDYELVAKSNSYLEGIRELMELAASSKVGFMCAEADYHHCHRYRLITRTLVQQGIEVKHILHNGQVDVSNSAEFLPEQPALF